MSVNPRTFGCYAKLIAIIKKLVTVDAQRKILMFICFFTHANKKNDFRKDDNITHYWFDKLRLENIRKQLTNSRSKIQIVRDNFREYSYDYDRKRK